MTPIIARFTRGWGRPRLPSSALWHGEHLQWWKSLCPTVCVYEMDEYVFDLIESDYVVKLYENWERLTYNDYEFHQKLLKGNCFGKFCSFRKFHVLNLTYTWQTRFLIKNVKNLRKRFRMETLFFSCKNHCFLWHVYKANSSFSFFFLMKTRFQRLRIEQKHCFHFLCVRAKTL